MPSPFRRKTLEDWLRDAHHDATKDGVIRAMQLWHCVNERPVREIHAIRIQQSIAWTEKDAAQLLEGKAAVYAQDLPGVQTFEVHVFYGENDQPQAFFPFTITGTLEFRGGVTESASDPKGPLQQGMRWGENIVNRMLAMQGQLHEASVHLMAQYQQLYQSQRNENLEIKQENRDAVQIINELMREKIELSHEQKMSELRFDRETEERKKLMTFMPIIVNQILGRKFMPQASEDTAFVEAIGEHLSKLPKSEIAKLAANLPAELWGPLMSRLTEYEQKKTKELEHTKTGEKLLKEGNEQDLLEGADDFSDTKAAE